MPAGPIRSGICLRSPGKRAFRPDARKGRIRLQQAKRAGAQLIATGAGHKIHNASGSPAHTGQPHQTPLAPGVLKQKAGSKLILDTHIKSHGTGLLPARGIKQPSLRGPGTLCGKLRRLLAPQAAHVLTQPLLGHSRVLPLIHARQGRSLRPGLSGCPAVARVQQAVIRFQRGGLCPCAAFAEGVIRIFFTHAGPFLIW